MSTINFGIVLKELRKNAGLTQIQLAEQLGVSKSVVSYYEQLTRIPSPEVLIKLAAIFHVSTDFLLGVDNVPRLDVSGLSYEDIRIISLLVESLRNKSKK